MTLVLFVPFQRSNAIGSRVRSDLVSIPPSFFVLINIHQTKKGQLYQIQCYIDLSYHSFDTNFISLGLSLTKIHAVL